jgi:hypothetical protein
VELGHGHGHPRGDIGPAGEPTARVRPARHALRGPRRRIASNSERIGTATDDRPEGADTRAPDTRADHQAGRSRSTARRSEAAGSGQQTPNQCIQLGCAHLIPIGSTDHQQRPTAEFAGSPQRPDHCSQPPAQAVAYHGTTHRSANGKAQCQVGGCLVHANNNRIRAGTSGNPFASQYRERLPPA